ncbi:ClpP/crotonase-like domain-containing protein [Paraphoma chrysanthemicola]|uniref:ClpP/crotonase-like domain-containing protein n=1 Tax=Paraphoma chrysanthemicola TaxID=798071 RepID=A0A8K0VWA1_9PLEO|nr:ClpP/crotonase-like domain-containing protein [Paraphoma chrysanthemicola]
MPDLKTELKPPPPDPSILLSVPKPHVLLVTINRAKRMNSLPAPVQHYMHRVFEWFDLEPTLRVAVITGAGPKAFSAGQDLIELGERDPNSSEASSPISGFGGVSKRIGKKPVIAAVNGFAMGGGFEIVLNCDMTVASPTATFGLPEALRGIYAGGGGPPRLVHNVGMPLAAEITMIGRTLSATEALQYNLINKISASLETVVEEALALASKVANVSPDSITVTRAALRETWETASVQRGNDLIDARYLRALLETENSKEGLRAFKEKREPVWKAGKL